MNLRERVRFGDPFADKIQRSQPAAMPAPIVPAHMRKQMKKSGFVVPHVRPLTQCSLLSMGPSPSYSHMFWFDAALGAANLWLAIEFGPVARTFMGVKQLEERQGLHFTSSVAWGLLCS